MKTIIRKKLLEEGQRNEVFRWDLKGNIGVFADMDADCKYQELFRE